MYNNQTGIFIWYKTLDTTTNKATIEVYKAGLGQPYTEAQILQFTPPSRPMGIRVLPCDSLPTIDGYKRVKIRWNHNMEPDMPNIVQGYQSYTKKYKVYRSTAANMSLVPPDAMQFPQQYYQHIATVYIDETEMPGFVDTEIISICNTGVCDPPNYCIEYPIRYRVQAVDKYNDISVLSDFAKTTGGRLEDGPDNINFSNVENELPKEYSLKQNFPNPFNPSTNIQYDLPKDNFVSIKVYDLLGKEMMSLVNEFKDAGRYIISFNGSNLPSGIYYYKIKAGDFVQVRKMILLK